MLVPRKEQAASGGPGGTGSDGTSMSPGLRVPRRSWSTLTRWPSAFRLLCLTPTMTPTPRICSATSLAPADGVTVERVTGLHVQPGEGALDLVEGVGARGAEDDDGAPAGRRQLRDDSPPPRLVALDGDLVSDPDGVGVALA